MARPGDRNRSWYRPCAAFLPGAKIRTSHKVENCFREYHAEHHVTRLTQLRGLSVGKKPLEAVEGEIQLLLSRGRHHNQRWTGSCRPAFSPCRACDHHRRTVDVCRSAESRECGKGTSIEDQTTRRVGTGKMCPSRREHRLTRYSNFTGSEG